MKKIGFDNDKYLKEQSRAILERINLFNNKLYLEFGGKILYDYHAARVLPGYDPNIKVRLLKTLKEKTEIILCISSSQIEKRKIRADFGVTYDVDLLKMIDELRDWQIEVAGVVMTCFAEQPAAIVFRKKLERMGIRVYAHSYTRGYPTDVDLIVSDKGYGANDYIPTSKPLVVVAGPGPGSGKLGTALSQLYHEYKKGIVAGYAKFETFPVWDLALKHPLNMTYEAATADMGDYNLIDPFHLESYNKIAINYNRDIEVFPVLKRILEKIIGNESIYRSPTDMGVNRCSAGIKDDVIIRQACFQEIIRRYFRYACEYSLGLVEKETVQKIELLMKELDIKPEDRKVVAAAREAADQAREQGKGNEGIFCGASVQLPNGNIISGKNSSLMHAASSMILNAVKVLSDVPDHIHLISPGIIESITVFKKNIMGAKSPSINLEETLIALSISSATNPTAQLAIEKLSELKGCEAHTTNMPAPGDESALRQLKINLTSDY
jgi:uncharacterized protein (UPF0371 family)